MVLSPTTHRFFNQLATAQAATAAYTLGHRAQAGGTVQGYSSGSPISQACFTIPQEIEFDPDEVLGPISKHFTWPTVIHLNFHPGGGRFALNSSLTAVQLLMGSLYEHAFITYFENSVDAIFTKHRGKKHWPAVLNFGRIVRNAFAHGGTINITDHIPGTWGGVAYSESDNGRRVLYNDLTSGDLTLLMIEMDAAF